MSKTKILGRLVGGPGDNLVCDLEVSPDRPRCTMIWRRKFESLDAYFYEGVWDQRSSEVALRYVGPTHSDP